MTKLNSYFNCSNVTELAKFLKILEKTLIPPLEKCKRFLRTIMGHCS